MLRQKTRIQWLEVGDGNNKIFHRSLLARRNKTQIWKIKTYDWRVIENEDGIREEA